MRVLATAAALSIATSARADVLSLDAAGCRGVDAREVQRVLDLELSTLAVQGRVAPSIAVELACAPGQIRIAIREPSTGREVVRDIPAPAESDRGRERVIALAASQLVVASWLEQPPPAQPARLPGRERAVIAPEARPSAPIVLDIHGGARVRDLASPVALLRIGAGAGLAWSPRWSTFADFTFERGDARRRSGDVAITSLSFGAGAALRIADAGAFRLDERILVAGSYGRLDGRPAAGFGSSHATGFSVELGLGIGPSLRIGALRIAIDAEGGAALAGPVGRVIGEDPVAVRGAWFGGDLRLGADFARP